MRRAPGALDWRPSGLEARRIGPLMARLAGTGGVPVVLLHGLAASGGVWGGVWEELADRGTLLLPDLLGFGRSSRPLTTYRLDDHAATVVECMAAAGIDGPAVVVGHSFGALVALALARHRPDLVAGLGLLSPPLHADPASARRRTVAALSRLERRIAMDTRVAERLCRAICTNRPRLAARLAIWLRPELPREIARSGVLHSWESYSRSFAELLGARARPDWIGELRIPVRIVLGDGDRCLDHELLVGLGEAHDHVVVDVVPGRDHLLPLQAPRLCMERVEEMRRATDPAIAEQAG